MNIFSSPICIKYIPASLLFNLKYLFVWRLVMIAWAINHLFLPICCRKSFYLFSLRETLNWLKIVNWKMKENVGEFCIVCSYVRWWDVVIVYNRSFRAPIIIHKEIVLIAMFALRGCLKSKDIWKIWFGYNWDVN